MSGNRGFFNYFISLVINDELLLTSRTRDTIDVLNKTVNDAQTLLGKRYQFHLLNVMTWLPIHI